MNKYWLIGLVGVALFGCEKTTNVQNVYCNTNADCKNPLYPQCYPQVHSCGQANLDLGGFDIGVPDMASDMPSSADLLPPPDLLPMCTTATVSVCVDPAKPVCGASGNCAACTAADDGQCSAKVSGNVCITTGANIGQCGQCNPSPSPMESGKCLTPTIPVCGSDGTCRKCQANSECSTNVCLPNGSCAAPGTVIYVNNGNSCTGTTHAGSVADPYCEIQDAQAGISGTKKIISVAGSAKEYVEQVAVGGGASFSIVGPGNSAGTTATILVPSDYAVKLLVASGSATLNIAGMVIGDPSSGTGRGIACVNTGTAATLNITNSTIQKSISGGIEGTPGTPTTNCAIILTGNTVQNNSGAGISTSGGSLTLTGNTVQNNSGAGISTSGGSLTLTGNTVQNNKTGGLSTSSTPYTIVNNLFVGNSGGVGVTFSGTESGLFWFNTVADNQGTLNAVGGFDCEVAALIQASLVFDNSKSSSTHQSYGGISTCSFDYSYLDDAVTPTGSGNGLASPNPFTTVGAYAYALAPGAIEEGKVQASSTGLMPMGSPLPMTDVAGNPRPRTTSPAGWDVGAWQVPTP